jgi:hypothetical protein
MPLSGPAHIAALRQVLGDLDLGSAICFGRTQSVFTDAAGLRADLNMLHAITFQMTEYSP